MALKNTQEFIKKLESEGELKRISAQIDPVLEVTEIADRMSKTNGPALRWSASPSMISAVASNHSSKSSRQAVSSKK
jgi:4-hydroxy-3-polyprenylbenzoate decarboxylase